MSTPTGPPRLTPRERVEAMRAAFSAMLRDKEFLDDAAKQKMEIVDPMDGATLQATVARLLATDTGVVAAVRRAVGGEAGAR